MTDSSSTPTALLQAHAVRWVDTNGWPWVIEVAFEDVEGKRHTLIDKVPLFAFEVEPGPDTVFPTLVVLDCHVLEADQSTSHLRIAVDHRSINEGGPAEFTVRRSSVVGVPDGETTGLGARNTGGLR